jgi:hypothetical protein
MAAGRFLGVTLAISTVLQVCLVDALGIKRVVVGGVDAVAGDDPVCSAGQLYTIDMTTVSNISPTITAPTNISCGIRNKSIVKVDSCEWFPADFLHMLYNRAIELMRHGVPQADAFQCFLHARGVLYNFQICDPIHNDETRVTIPVALELFYGKIFSMMQAKYATGLQVAPSPLTAEATLALVDLAHVSSELNVDIEFPDELMARKNLADPQPTFAPNLLVRNASPESERKTVSELPATSRQAYVPNYNCNHSGAPANTWTLRKYPGNPEHADQHCCAAGNLSTVQKRPVDTYPKVQ